MVKFAACRFYIEDGGKEYVTNPKAPMSDMFGEYEWEVVGNIYDNLELLEKGGEK